MVRARELEKLGEIKEVVIYKEKNQHSQCEIALYLDCDDAVWQLRKLIGTDVCIEDDKRIYMRGTIRKIHCNNTFSGSNALINVFSYSDKADIYKKKRIFQNTKKKYKEIVKALCNDECCIQITDSTFANKEESSVLVQDEITDFDFIKLISNRMGYDVFVIDTEKKPLINIALHSDYAAQKSLNKNNIILYKFYKDDFVEVLSIRSRDFLELGQITEYEGDLYVVAAVKIIYKDGTNKYSYRLEKKIKDAEHASRFNGFLGAAKVVENKDPNKKGQIQVSFLDYEDLLEDNRIWIPYLPCLTEKEQGIMLIPGINEVVNIFCKDGMCYSDGCIRMIAYDERISNPEERIFMFKDKYIAFKDKCVELDVFNNKILLNNDQFIWVKDNNSLKIEKESMYLQIGDVKIKFGGQGVQLQSPNKISLKSNEVAIAGRRRISAKTFSFDIDK